MQINEIFYSLQGEGFNLGRPSIFIRLSGCPLRCRWCDTKYAWSDQSGTHLGVGDILQEIEKTPCKNIVITGGEPSINPHLPELTAALKQRHYRITIETAGIAYMPTVKCDLISISPKLSNSIPSDAESAAVHNDSKLDLAIIRKLIDSYPYQLKFVVEAPEDLDEIQATIDEIKHVNPNRILLMPQAATRREFFEKAPMVAELCKQTNLTFSHRLQLLLWNGRKGV